MESELGSVAWISGFFSFLLIPYAAMSFVETSKELLDVVYDFLAGGVAVGIVVLAVTQSGVEGLVAVGVGVGLTLIGFGTMAGVVAVMGIGASLLSPTR